jgi:formylglycine-generating enzyme required for sulfatase activity
MNKLNYRFLPLMILVCILMVCIAACKDGDNGDDGTSVTGVTLNKTGTTILEGETEQLTATVTPSGADNQNVSWSSSDSSIVTVSTSGLITAVERGSTVITVTTDDGGYTATCDVTVVDMFDLADTPGDVVSVTAGLVSFDMIYANNQSSITFPTELDDSGTGTLTRKFFMAETEVTNALMVEVLQWAYDNGKFSTTVGDHNGLDSTKAKYGGQELLDLDYVHIKINYASGSFTVDAGYENHPVICVTWYGAVMFCNWLTEMTDGDTDNLVYSGIDTSWDHTETVEDQSKTGYRLPSNEEWEFTARYIGQAVPTVENLASEYVSQNHNNGDPSLTAGYYWTPGDYASGSEKDHINETETGEVAWYNGTPPAGELKAVAGKIRNQLGIYDMSGNACEWCFTVSGSDRMFRGGRWNGGAVGLQVGFCDGIDPDFEDDNIGFRLARTQ